MSFGSIIDRYLDSEYKKIQIPSSIFSAFSEGLNLANNLIKSCMYICTSIPASFAQEGHTLLTPWLSQSTLPIVFTLPHWLCGSFQWLQSQIRVKCHYVAFTETPINTLMQSWPHSVSMTLTMYVQLTLTKMHFPGAMSNQGACSQLCITVKQ